MTGQPSIVSDIPRAKHSLEERGLPPGSYFEVEFEDGSVAREHDHNWSDLSEPMAVDSLGTRKAAHVARFRVKRISVFHEGLSTTIEVPEGCAPYQAVRAETVLGPHMPRRDRILGRVVGIVDKDGRILEERLLDGVAGQITGYRR